MRDGTVYFVGIGGIGMSALAQLYVSRGISVRGSDREASPVTELLSTHGVEVLFGHDAANLTEETALLVYSDAIPEDNPERVKARTLHIPELSYFEALGEATKEGVSIVVSGTHGKTSTTAMVAKLLIDAGKEPTVIAGSILNEHGSNFVAGKDDLFVIEGCEYKRHFLHLHPHILVITNVEHDHTDYYKTFDDMQDAFREVLDLVPESGTVITDTSSKNISPLLDATRAHVVPYQEVTIPKLLVPGEFNQANARAAKAALCALDPDVHEKDVDASLQKFKGTWRRFEYKGVMQSGATVYDDYAHHPTAIAGTIAMVREEFPNKRVVVVFHPHLHSRTKSFFDEFATVLADSDVVLVLPIYAAREEKDSAVTSEALTKEINKRGGKAFYVKNFSVAENFLKDGASEDMLILTMGAGDVYKIAEQLI